MSEDFRHLEAFVVDAVRVEESRVILMLGVRRRETVQELGKKLGNSKTASSKIG